MKKINLVVLLTSLMAMATFAGSGSVQILTISEETEEPITGICYGLYSDSGCKELVQEGSGNNCGIITFNKLNEGKYWLSNKWTSCGFKKDTTTQEVNVKYGLCTPVEVAFTPSTDTESSGPLTGKFTSFIKGTISGKDLNNIRDNYQIRYVCSFDGTMTPEYGLIPKKNSSYFTTKDVSIKCVPFGNSLQFKFGTGEARYFLSVETSPAPPDPEEGNGGENGGDNGGDNGGEGGEGGEAITADDEGETEWEPVVFINDKTAYGFSGKLSFKEEPKYMYDCAVKFTFGSGKADFVSDSIPLQAKGKNFVGTLDIKDGESTVGNIKVKINSVTGKSKFSVKGNDAIGVESRYEPVESK